MKENKSYNGFIESDTQTYRCRLSKSTFYFIKIEKGKPLSVRFGYVDISKYEKSELSEIIEEYYCSVSCFKKLFESEKDYTSTIAECIFDREVESFPCRSCLKNLKEAKVFVKSKINEVVSSNA